jgi:hypothetical protein
MCPLPRGKEEGRVSLYITGYRFLAYDNNTHSLPAPQVPEEYNERLPITSIGNVSKPFTDMTRFICLVAEADCWLAFGEDPEARVGVHPMRAGERFYGVFPGHRLSVIAGDDE